MRLTPPRLASLRMAGLVMPWMLSLRSSCVKDLTWTADCYGWAVCLQGSAASVVSW